jgi:hypothetical protein
MLDGNLLFIRNVRCTVYIYIYIYVCVCVCVCLCVCLCKRCTCVCLPLMGSETRKECSYGVTSFLNYSEAF